MKIPTDYESKSEVVPRVWIDWGDGDNSGEYIDCTDASKLRHTYHMSVTYLHLRLAGDIRWYTMYENGVMSTYLNLADVTQEIRVVGTNPIRQYSGYLPSTEYGSMPSYELGPMGYAFAYTKLLERVDGPLFNGLDYEITSPSYLTNMFAGSRVEHVANLTQGLTPSRVSKLNLSGMFYNCWYMNMMSSADWTWGVLPGGGIQGFSVVRMRHAFAGASASEIDWRPFSNMADIAPWGGGIIDVRGMFKDCRCFDWTGVPEVWEWLPNASHCGTFEGCENAPNVSSIPEDWIDPCPEGFVDENLKYPRSSIASSTPKPTPMPTTPPPAPSPTPLPTPSPTPSGPYRPVDGTMLLTVDMTHHGQELDLTATLGLGIGADYAGQNCNNLFDLEAEDADNLWCRIEWGEEGYLSSAWGNMNDPWYNESDTYTNLKNPTTIKHIYRSPGIYRIRITGRVCWCAPWSIDPETWPYSDSATHPEGEAGEMEIPSDLEWAALYRHLTEVEIRGISPIVAIPHYGFKCKGMMEDRYPFKYMYDAPLFGHCIYLKKITGDLFENLAEPNNYWNLDNETKTYYLGGMFYNCQSLESIDDTEIPLRVAARLDEALTCTTLDIGRTFMHCHKLTSYPHALYSNFGAYGKNVSGRHMFAHCLELGSTLYMNLPRGTRAIDYAYFNSGCPKLTDTGINKLIAYCLPHQGDPFDVKYACSGCTSLLYTFSITGQDNLGALANSVGAQNVNITGLYSGCAGVTGEAFPLWYYKNTRTIHASGAFRGCTKLSNYSAIPSDWK